MGRISGGAFISDYESSRIDELLRKVADIDAAGGVASYDSVDALSQKVTPVWGKGVNLLDNWYFGNADAIIDQRGGWIVPAGTLYSHSGSPTDDGEINVGYLEYPVAVDSWANDNVTGVSEPQFTYDGHHCWTGRGTAVRGYTGTGYTIDRWDQRSNVTSILGDDGIEIVTSETWNTGFVQRTELLQALTGKTVTLSAIIDGQLYKISADVTATINKLIVTTGAMRMGIVIDNGLLTVAFSPQALETHIIKAVKLELGDTQTLAHQDANGNWVLNDPPPNYGTELAKCQREQVPLKSGAPLSATTIQSNYIDFICPIPVEMRETPTISSGTTFAVIDNESGNIYTDFTFSVVGSFPGYLALRGTKTSHGIKNPAAWAVAAGMLDANL